MFNLAPPNRRSSLTVVPVLLVTGISKLCSWNFNNQSFKHFFLHLYQLATFFLNKAAIPDLCIAKYFNTRDTISHFCIIIKVIVV